MINRQERTFEAIEVTQIEVLALTPLYFWLKFKREDDGEISTPSAIANFLINHPRKSQLFSTLSDERVAKVCEMLDDIYTDDELVSDVKGIKRNGTTLDERITNAALAVLTIGGERLGVPLFCLPKRWQEKEHILKQIVANMISDERFLLEN